MNINGFKIIPAIVTMAFKLTACAANVSVMASRTYVDNATNAVYKAAKGYVDTAVEGAGKVQSVNGKTGEVVITAADLSAVTRDERGNVSVGGSLSAIDLTANSIIAGDITATSISVSSIITTAGLDIEDAIKTEISEREDGDAATLSAATNAANAYTDEAVKSATPANYAAVSNAAMTALQPDATNGLVTASVTNGLASAASVKQEAKDRAAAIVAEREDRESAGYLTAESDPVFAAWKTNEVIVVGHGNNVEYTSPSIVIGSGNDAGCDASAQQVIVIGNNNYADESEGGIFIGNDLRGVRLPDGTYTKHLPYFHVPWNPSRFVFCGAKLTLQSYLDERVKTNELASVAKSGDYNDLTNKPAIPTAQVESVNGKTGAVTLALSDLSDYRNDYPSYEKVYDLDTFPIVNGDIDLRYDGDFASGWNIDAGDITGWNVCATNSLRVFYETEDAPSFVAASGKVVFSNNWQGVRFYDGVTHHGPATFNDTVTFNGTATFAKGVKATSLGASGWYTDAIQSVELSAHTKSGGNERNYIRIVSRGDEGTKVSNITPDNSDVLTWNMFNAAIPSILDALDSETATAADIVVALQSIYAKFYTVTYVDGTGDGSGTKKVRNGRYAKEPVKPTSSTSTFLGWYASGSTNAFDFAGTAITNDVTLTAKWNKN